MSARKRPLPLCVLCGSDQVLSRTYKKVNQIFLIYKEILNGAVAKSYMRKVFPIYEEMRKYLTIYEEAVSHIWLCNFSILNFLISEENFIFFLSSAPPAAVDAAAWLRPAVIPFPDRVDGRFHVHPCGTVVQWLPEGSGDIFAHVGPDGCSGSEIQAELAALIKKEN